MTSNPPRQTSLAESCRGGAHKLSASPGASSRPAQELTAGTPLPSPGLQPEADPEAGQEEMVFGTGPQHLHPPEGSLAMPKVQAHLEAAPLAQEEFSTDPKLLYGLHLEENHLPGGPVALLAQQCHHLQDENNCLQGKPEGQLTTSQRLTRLIKQVKEMNASCRQVLEAVNNGQRERQRRMQETFGGERALCEHYIALLRCEGLGPSEDEVATTGHADNTAQQAHDLDAQEVTPHATDQHDVSKVLPCQL